MENLNPGQDQSLSDAIEASRRTDGPQRQLPRYRCHKEVWALKIKEVMLAPAGDHAIVPEDNRYGPFPITEEFRAKHNPQAGGYWVQYADGYTSYSPAEAFESGYTLIS